MRMIETAALWACIGAVLALAWTSGDRLATTLWTAAGFGLVGLAIEWRRKR